MPNFKQLRDADIFHLRAAARDQLGHPEEALADCNAALAADPHHIPALNVRGIVHMQLNDPEAALADLDAAIKLAPKWAWIPYLNRGAVHMNRYDFEAAIKDYDSVVDGLGASRDEEHQRIVAGALWKRGECQQQIGNIEQAEMDLGEALKLNPKLKDNLGGIG